VIQFILLFAVYLVVVVLGSYYVNLYVTHDRFSKEELKAVIPYLAQLGNKITADYSIPAIALTFGVASLLGIAFPMLSEHWFLNSSILFVALFLAFPLVKKNIERANVTTGGTLYDTAIFIFVKYYNFIVVGFGAGTATAIMYNWAVYKSIHFLWFLANFILISILTGIAVNHIAND